MRERNTIETNPTTIIVVVGGPEKLVEATRLASKVVPLAQVKTCDIQSVATMVASLWPFAIIMSDELYGFDSEEFEALARDVTAKLLRVSSEASAMQLESDLRPRLLDAFKARNE